MTQAKNPPIHPLAESWHPLSKADYAALVESIRENGQRHPIVMYQGAILDGRHRWRACEELGIEPRVEEWNGKGDILDVVANVANAQRHSTSGQKAWAAAHMVQWLKGEGEQRAKDAGSAQGEHGKKGGRGKKKPPGNESLPGGKGKGKKRDDGNRSVHRAAKKAGASIGATQAMVKIIEKHEAIGRLVRDGLATVDEAKRLAALPEKDQPAIVGRIVDGAKPKDVIQKPERKAKKDATSAPRMMPGSAVGTLLASDNGDKPAPDAPPWEGGEIEIDDAKDLPADLERVKRGAMGLAKMWPFDATKVAAALRSWADELEAKS